MSKLITERDVIDAHRKQKTELVVAANGIVTPSAQDAAAIRGIRILEKEIAKTSSGPQLSPQVQFSGKIIIGSDHGGFELKEILKDYLTELGLEFDDVGTYSTESVDYPDFAYAVAEKVTNDAGLLGIIVDGAGVGSAMAANKVRGIRAASCQDTYTARNSRLHNNANVLTLGSRSLGIDVAKEIVKVWLETRFERGRHKARVDKIMAIEKKLKV